MIHVRQPNDCPGYGCKQVKSDEIAFGVALPEDAANRVTLGRSLGVMPMS